MSDTNHKQIEIASGPTRQYRGSSVERYTGRHKRLLKTLQELDHKVDELNHIVKIEPWESEATLKRMLAIQRERERVMREMGSMVAAWCRTGGEISFIQESESAPSPSKDTPAPASMTAMNSSALENKTLTHAPSVSMTPAMGTPMLRTTPPRGVHITSKLSSHTEIPALNPRAYHESSARPPTPSETLRVTEALKQKLEQGMAPAIEEGKEDQLFTPQLLDTMLELVGRPRPRVSQELDAIEAFANEEMENLAKMKPETQVEVLAMVVARLRWVQDEPGWPTSPLDKQRWDRCFRMMLGHIRTERPGVVYGFRLDDQPQAGQTWLDDAQEIWQALRDNLLSLYRERPEVLIDQLRAAIRNDSDEDVRKGIITKLIACVSIGDQRISDLLESQRHLLSQKTRKRLDKAARRREDLRKEAEAETEEKAPDVPDDWPWMSVTRDARAVVTGGDERKRDYIRDRIHQAFRFSSLDWWDSVNHRHLQSLSERIARGSVDILIVLTRFASHRIEDGPVSVARQHGVPVVRVLGGYGVTQIQRAMEEQLNVKEASEKDNKIEGK